MAVSRVDTQSKRPSPSSQPAATLRICSLRSTKYAYGSHCSASANR